MEKIVSHKDLTVWQKAVDLVVLVYQITQSFPKEEIYALTNQMRRCFHLLFLPISLKDQAEGTLVNLGNSYILL